MHLGEAADLIEAIRLITPHPWTVVNTHSHWDHCFGNAAFRPAEIWGHAAAAHALGATGELQREELLALERLIRDTLPRSSGATSEYPGPLPAGSPYDEERTRLAVQRGWLQARG